MQTCANLACFTACYSMAALITQTLNVYLSSQITSVEKQFGFSSSQVGIIMSGNDIGFLVTVLFVSHFASKSHIPRCLGNSTFLFGVSGIACCLTFFLDYAPDDQVSLTKDTTSVTFQKTVDYLLCNETVNGVKRLKNDSLECSEKGVQNQASRTRSAFVIFMVGMLLQGVAKSPRTSLITSYIDNNLADKNKTGMYIGIITSAAIFGPAIAFLMSGVFSKIPVDLKDNGLRPNDPRWIGAWWMGYLLFGLLSIVISIPLFFFPKTSNSSSYQNEDEEASDQKSHIVDQIKELPKSLLRVLKNPVYDFTLLSTCVLLFSVAGSLSFTQKYVEHQFTQPSWKTNVILGIEKVIGSSTGTLVGGVLTTKLRLSRQGCLKFKIISAFIAAGLEAFGFLFGCPQSDISGVTWKDTNGFKKAGINVTYPCQTTCSCPEKIYPVCGSNRLNYLSPCLAGCETFNQTLKLYESCQCIPNGGTSTSGLCETDCPYLYPFIAMHLFKSFISTAGIVPAYVVLLRSVLDEDKAIAVGLMSFLTSLLGWLPGPIIFGLIFDSTCVWWSEKCDITGECLLYDIKDMRLKVHILAVSLRFVTGLIMVAALVAAYIEEKRLKEKGESDLFSRKMTLKEVKSPARRSNANALQTSGSAIQTVDRTKYESEEKMNTVANEDVSAGDEALDTSLNISTHL